ncbi:Mss4p nuclear export [Tilletia horrida]|nr:Mss4p nuclear export [Tilletia horrida]
MASTTADSRKRKQPSAAPGSTADASADAAKTKQTTVQDGDEEDDDEDDDETPESINVDFAFLTPDPAIDSQALRRLLQQLLYTHAPTLNLHAVVDTALVQAAQLGIGTVVKLDLTPEEQAAQGEEADPYALITALPSTAPAAAEVLLPYVRARLASGPAPFTAALDAAHKAGALLCLLHERMVNLPPQLAPPLFRILLSELKPFLTKGGSAAAAVESAAAAADASTQKITQAITRLGSAAGPLQVLFFTRLYSDAALSDDEDEDMDDAGDGDAKIRKKKPSFAQRRQKRRKAEQQQQQQGTDASNDGSADGSSLHYFHPEDEVLIKYATQTHTFRFPPPPSAVSSFEAPIFGRFFLVPLSALLDPSQPPQPDADVKLGPALLELEKALAA